MSLPIIWWPVIPETLEARLIQAEADARFAEQWENANFESSAESMAHALWGIWEVPIDKWLNTALNIRNMEAQDRENPDLILSQLDDWWENAEENNRLRETNIYTPSIHYLQEKGIINSWEANSLIEHFINWWTVDNIWEANIFTDTDKESEVIQILQTMTEWEEWRENGLKRFWEIFWETLWIQRNSRWEIIWARKNEAYNMIGSQFFILDEAEDNSEYSKEFDTAIHTAYNILLDGAIDIKWQDEKFERLTEIILDSTKSPEERFQAFTEFLEFGHTQKWFGKLQERNFRIRQAEQKLEDAGKFKIFMELLYRFQTEDISQAMNIKIALELEKIRLESWLTEPEATLLAGWEIDTWPDTQVENPREA